MAKQIRHPKSEVAASEGPLAGRGKVKSEAQNPKTERGDGRWQMAVLTTNSGLSLPPVAGSPTNGLRDIKPPVDVPSGWAWAWWLLGAIAAALLAWWLWNYWQKRQALRPLPPPIPPHVRARKRLEEALALLTQPKPFVIAVSDALRAYLEERFSFRAPERTTEEFLHELQSTNLLDPSQKERLSEFLQRCDLVKFAKYEPREMELRDLHASAVRLVDETEPRGVEIPKSEIRNSDEDAPSEGPLAGRGKL